MRRTPLRLLGAAVAVLGLALLLATKSCEGDQAPRYSPPGPAADDPPAGRRARPPVQRARPDAPPTESADAPAAPAPAPADETAAAVEPKTFRIHGRVIDDLRVGIAEARIEIRAWSGTEPDVTWFTVSVVTDRNGNFERMLDEANATIGFGIETAADGFVEGWQSLKRAEYDATRGVEIVVERARAIAGRVIDDDARPVPGTTVQLWYGSETTWPTEVDADGRFRTPQRAPRRALELIVEAPGFTRRSVPIAAADEELRDVGDIVFHRAGRVAGLVVGTDGRPIEDVPLELGSVVASKGRSRPACRTDSAGRFSFDGVGDDLVTIYVDCAQRGGPAGARRFFQGGAAGIRPGRTDVRIVARAAVTLTLRFVDADTHAALDLKKAEYGLRDEGAPEPERLGQGASSSDPLVSTTLSAECGRRYDLTVRAAGFEDGHVNGIEVGDAAEMSIDVPMRRAK